MSNLPCNSCIILRHHCPFLQVTEFSLSFRLVATLEFHLDLKMFLSVCFLFRSSVIMQTLSCFLLELLLLPFCFPWMISQTKSFESLLNNGCHATGLVDGHTPSVCVCRVDTKKTWWTQCMHIHVSFAFPSCVFHPFQISSWSSSASKREGSCIDLQAQAPGNKGENESEFLYEKQRK
jgi:hypothetical protein